LSLSPTQSSDGPLIAKSGLPGGGGAVDVEVVGGAVVEEVGAVVVTATPRIFSSNSLSIPLYSAITITVPGVKAFNSPLSSIEAEPVSFITVHEISAPLGILEISVI
jgi:hypothetical protein